MEINGNKLLESS